MKQKQVKEEKVVREEYWDFMYYSSYTVYTH